MAPQVFPGMQIVEMVVNIYLVSAYKIDVALPMPSNHSHTTLSPIFQQRLQSI